MFVGQTHNLPFIDRYARAKKHWDTTNKPRSSMWHDHQRPLKDSRSYHYRIESLSPDKYIDVCLHRTVMARFYAPNEDGNESRLYMGHDSRTSRNFMRDVLGIYHTAETVHGRKVAAPVCSTPFMRDDGTLFSARFVYAPGDKLIPSLSQHTRHWRKISSDEDKAERALARRRWEPYITLAQYRLQEFVAHVTINYDYGKPFRSRPLAYGMLGAVRELDKCLKRDELPRQEHIDDFFAMCQYVFDTAASKRGYTQRGFSMGHRWGQTGADPYELLERPVTEAEFAKAVEAKVFDIIGVTHKKGAVEIPQFVSASDYPRSNVFAREMD